jgi:hypothetical protein
LEVVEIGLKSVYHGADNQLQVFKKATSVIRGGFLI